MLQRRIESIKGLSAALAAKLHRVNDVVKDMTVVADTAEFDEKVISARLAKVQQALNVKKADIVALADALDTAEYDDKIVNARDVYNLKAAMDGMAAGITFMGSFDINTETALPTGDGAKAGALYKVSNSGASPEATVEIGGFELTQNDTLISSGTEWTHIDNTESADILRVVNISTDADFAVDPSKLTTRAAVKALVDSKEASFCNDPIVINGSTATTAHVVKNDTIFLGIIRIDNGDGTYDDAACTVSGQTVTIDSSEDYDGKTGVVTYAY